MARSEREPESISQTPSPFRLRPAREADRAFLLGLAREAFGIYGDYPRLLREWWETPGVETMVAEEEGRPVGLSLLAFFSDSPAPGSPAAPGLVADLLAIAVVPFARGRGLGRALLERVILRSREAARSYPIRAIRLTVAEENVPARRLFESAGFSYLGGENRYYPQGQRALPMRLALE